MYRGFNLKLEINKNSFYWTCHSMGVAMHEKNLAKIRPYLKGFIQRDKRLNGGAIQEAWFPQIKVDVFISHSHNNLELALFLAGWLQKEFKINAFIDACVWGHASELLWEIDSAHCMIGANSFSYELRNHSTSHVHMMLSTALNMMMDKTESVFFLNTPDSIQSYDSIDKTESPWLYAEIAATHFLAIRVPDRRKVFVNESTYNFTGDEHLEKSLKMVHPVDLSHLNELDLNHLKLWRDSKSLKLHPLDILYDIVCPITK